MIFFDIDGTLIDHATASAQASVNFFDQFSGSIPSRASNFPLFGKKSSTNTLTVSAGAKFRSGNNDGRG